MDAMSGGGGGGGGSAGMNTPGLGMVGGGISYFDKNAANQNARALNATNSKWAPLLALYGSQGQKNVDVPTASLAAEMYKGLLADLAAGDPMGKGGGSMPMGRGVSSDSGGGQAAATGQLGAMDMTGGGFMSGLGQASSMPIGYADGGMIQHIGSLLPLLMMLSKGGKVPGHAPIPGDSPVNDVTLAAVSPGEGVVPRSVMQHPTTRNVSGYLHAVKKHGPGPLNKSSWPGAMEGGKPTKPKSSSLSPWSAMCGGGKV